MVPLRRQQPASRQNITTAAEHFYHARPQPSRARLRRHRPGPPAIANTAYYSAMGRKRTSPAMLGQGLSVRCVPGQRVRGQGEHYCPSHPTTDRAGEPPMPSLTLHPLSRSPDPGRQPACQWHDHASLWFQPGRGAGHAGIPGTALNAAGLASHRHRLHRRRRPAGAGGKIGCGNDLATARLIHAVYGGANKPACPYC